MGLPSGKLNHTSSILKCQSWLRTQLFTLTSSKKSATCQLPTPSNMHTMLSMTRTSDSMPQLDLDFLLPTEKDSAESVKELTSKLRDLSADPADSREMAPSSAELTDSAELADSLVVLAELVVSAETVED